MIRGYFTLIFIIINCIQYLVYAKQEQWFTYSHPPITRGTWGHSSCLFSLPVLPSPAELCLICSLPFPVIARLWREKIGRNDGVFFCHNSWMYFCLVYLKWFKHDIIFFSLFKRSICIPVIYYALMIQLSGRRGRGVVKMNIIILNIFSSYSSFHMNIFL